MNMSVGAAAGLSSTLALAVVVCIFVQSVGLLLQLRGIVNGNGDIRSVSARHPEAKNIHHFWSDGGCGRRPLGYSHIFPRSLLELSKRGGLTGGLELFS